jgi:GNAT superfamily N-acetyltransferase
LNECLNAEVSLSNRRLTPAEAVLLHEELRTTPNILGYTVSELLAFKEVLIAEGIGVEDGNFLAGVCISKDLRFEWTELAVLYVLPGFRGRGVGGLLFTKAFTEAEKRRRHIFALSRSPETIHLMERFGMTLVGSAWKAPFAVHLGMSRHMMSLYRLREGLRKERMRRGDGLRFVAGTKRSTKTNR